MKITPSAKIQRKGRPQWRPEQKRDAKIRLPNKQSNSLRNNKDKPNNDLKL